MLNYLITNWGDDVTLLVKKRFFFLYSGFYY